MKVAINGLGRIGRAVFKAVLEHKTFELAAVNDLAPPENLAYLLNYDTAYGRYPRRVEAGQDALQVGGRRYPVLNIKQPADLPWGDMGVELVFECTGIFTHREDLEKHLQAGASRVILSAPAKSPEILTVVPGTSPGGRKETIVSCASCTTNCITPVVEVMNRRLGVRKAGMTTIHAYTSTQSIVDGPAKKFRRGRAAAANLVPTSTGAAVATAKVLPEMEGLFNGVAVRAPVPVGSLADMTFLVKRATEKEAVNTFFREEAASERYHDVLGVSEDPIVSSDVIRDPRASVVDASMTQVIDGDLVKVMSWYDNEWGYAQQMIREALAAG